MNKIVSLNKQVQTYNDLKTASAIAATIAVAIGVIALIAVGGNIHGMDGLVTGVLGGAAGLALIGFAINSVMATRTDKKRAQIELDNERNYSGSNSETFGDILRRSEN